MGSDAWAVRGRCVLRRLGLLACRDMWVWMLATRVSGQVKDGAGRWECVRLSRCVDVDAGDPRVGTGEDAARDRFAACAFLT
jgi:hypothetical protein